MSRFNQKKYEAYKETRKCSTTGQKWAMETARDCSQITDLTEKDIRLSLYKQGQELRCTMIKNYNISTFIIHWNAINRSKGTEPNQEFSNFSGQIIHPLYIWCPSSSFFIMDKNDVSYIPTDHNEQQNKKKPGQTTDPWSLGIHTKQSKIY